MLVIKLVHPDMDEAVKEGNGHEEENGQDERDHRFYSGALLESFMNDLFKVRYLCELLVDRLTSLFQPLDPLSLSLRVHRTLPWSPPL